MSVVVTMVGGLGNNLFQYAVGRIIAEHHGYALRCDRPVLPPSSFLGRPVDDGPLVTMHDVAACFPHAPLTMAGLEFDERVERFELVDGDPWEGHTIDLAQILANLAPRQVRLTGFFQRFDYIEPYRNRVRRWLTPAAIPTPYVISPTDVLVNVRRGFDYGMLNWTLSASYYRKVLEGMRDVTRVYVCGTCIDDSVRRVLQPYNPVYFDASPMEHFAFMMRFKRIVLSNSTFAWWAAFLSDASEIHAARSPDGRAFAFTGWHDVDLHMREPRYIEVAGADLAAFTPLVVTRRAANDTADALDADAREILSWMMHERRALSLGELKARFSTVDVRGTLYSYVDVSGTLRQLLDAGLVSPDTTYVDES
jgi:hypothetical protein